VLDPVYNASNNDNREYTLIISCDSILREICVDGLLKKMNLIFMAKSKLSKKDSRISSENPATGKKGPKKKPKLYPIPPEDSFFPLQEDSEEVKYIAMKNKI
jgi:hypothetical protein